MSERRLYKPIEDMFKKNGFLSISARVKLPNEKVHSAFAVDIHGVPKVIDAVAFKWKENGDLQAKAVECKRGTTWEAAGEALGQATAYQRVFPEVYVATEVSESELKHIESLLRQLGLGYIAVTDGRAEEIFPPSQNIRFNKKEFELQVKGKVAPLFAGLDVFGKERYQFGSANEPCHIWVSSIDQPCNVVCSYNCADGRRYFWLALNLERKRAVEKFLRSVKAEELHDLFSKLPQEYLLRLRRFVSYRPKNYADEEQVPVYDMNVHKIEDVIIKIKNWKWQAHIQVRKEFEAEVYSRTDVSNELRKTVTDLTPLKQLIDSITKS